MHRTTTAIAALLAIGAAGCANNPHGVSTAHSPRPAGFTTNIDNTWLPLRPGTTLTYEGTKDGQPQRDVFRVTPQTKVIGGVRTLVVDDRVYSHGRLSERTDDYYAQDRHGNVWYFGEDTAKLDAMGRVTSTEGTWHTGVNGARAGLFMPAKPYIGEQHRQEYLKGHAEDQFRVASLRSQIRVPYRDFRNALQTREWTRLEPGVLDAKYYVRGIGEIYEGSLKGPREVARLVRVVR